MRALAGALTGSFATAGDPALQFHMAPVVVQGLDNAVYFEINRADSIGAPFRQGILHAYRFGKGLRLRMFNFAGLETLPGAAVGLWLAPEAFPEISAAQLAASMDFDMTRSGDAWTGRSPHPFPTTRDGAVEMTGEFSIGPSGIRIADTGRDAAGKPVWGAGAGSGVPAGGLAFAPFKPNATVDRRESGLIVIDLVPPTPGELAVADGLELAVMYSGYLRSDGLMFDSNRRAGREPFLLKYPPQLIEGWLQGLPGMTRGTWRKFVIPGHLGYGERGNPRARIPPDATLLFEVECIYLAPPQAPADPAATPGTPAPAGTPK